MGKPEPPEPMSAPEWIVTFSDVVSLLVTFFVLILTFSTLETQEMEKLNGALQGSFGMMTKEFVSNRSSVDPPSDINIDVERERGAKVPFARSIEKLSSELEDIMLKRRLEQELKIAEIEGGLRIRLEADRMFNPGSAKVRHDFLPVIENLKNVLGFYPNKIVIEGHTDASFTGMSRYPAGYELAGDMARAVATLLIDDNGVMPKKVSVRSYGATFPVESNGSEKGRALNRRVDILILED